MPELNSSTGLSEDPEFVFGPPVSEMFRNPANYDASPDLVAAVRVALLLGMPLLLTGEPGCGKTSVAYWLAWKLNLDTPLVYNVKSTSTGRELLYEFDELGRFRDSQAHEKRPTEEYVRLNALGLAILYSNDPYAPLEGGALPYLALAALPWTIATSDSRFTRRNVVLIDELDKAPRDTPNDLLLEVDQMRFRINELNAWVNGQPEHRPIIVVTSNSEKSLPEPFLRRCVFHHIKSPDDERRRLIVARRMHPFAKRGDLFNKAMRYFEGLHGILSRTPGTAELLAWLTVLEENVSQAENRHRDGVPSPDIKTLMRSTLGTLAKTKEDLMRAEQVLESEKLD